MRRRFTATIHGVVQGVLFRQSARREALRLGLAGTARNRPDGTVHVTAEGEERGLREFLSWLHHGPERAVVERVDVAWTEPRGDAEDFRVDG